MREVPESWLRKRLARLASSLTLFSFAGLVTGLAVGITLHGSNHAPTVAVAESVELLGTLWTNALRMTVLPLVVSQLVLAITIRSSPTSLGRLGGTTFLVFVTILGGAAVFAAIVTPPALALVPISPDAVATLRESIAVVDAGAPDGLEVPRLGDWLGGLIPVNPVEAAADGAILPVIVFTVVFAFALTRVSEEWRIPLQTLFRSVSEVTLVVVRWVLMCTPVGVFALAMALSRQTGFDAVSAVAVFIGMVSAELFFFTLLLYPVAIWVGGLRLRDFAHAVAPAQVVAVSTRSSLASLPALLSGAETRLGISTSIAGFVLPLSVASFKISVVLANLVTGLFLARLYGIDLALFEVTAFAVTLMLLSFGAPGIPSLGVTALPAFMAVGIPVEGVLLLHAVDLIPDIFKTLLNVTGDMTATAVVARRAPSTDPIGPS